MNASPVLLLERQVQRVRNRLFAQLLLNRLIVAWCVGCGLMAVWVLARPYASYGLGHAAKPWMDWTAGGSIFGLATILAVWQAIHRLPDKVSAALSLDERFGLRERVTTSLMLSPGESYSSAGQALLADVNDRVGTLHVGSKFPIRLGWKSALVPASAIALALLMVFYDPYIPPVQGGTEQVTQLPPETVKDLEQKKQEFLNRPKPQTKPDAPPKSEDVRRIEAQIEEIMKRPATTDKELKDRLSELTDAEQALRKKTDEEAAKSKSFDDQMKQLDQLQKKRKEEGKSKDSAAKDAKDALAKGDTEKAKEEFDRLQKKVKGGDMTQKDKEELKQELKDLKNDLEKLAREKEKEEEEKRQEREQKMREQMQEGKLDKEEFDKEMKKMDQERKQKQETQELADKLEQAGKALDKDDTDGAASALKDAAEQLEKMEQRDKNIDSQENDLQRLSDIRDSMGKACDKCEGRDSKEGDAETLNRNNPDDGDKDGKGGKGSKKGGKGVGRRPENKSGDSKSVDEKQNAPFNTKGTKIHVGTAEGKSIIGQTGASVEGEIKQASQDAPDAIEVQRIPKGYKDSAKGYFKNIGNQQTTMPAPKK